MPTIEESLFCPICEEQTLPRVHEDENVVVCTNLNCNSIIDSKMKLVGVIIRGRPKYDIKLSPAVELDTTKGHSLIEKMQEELNILNIEKSSREMRVQRAILEIETILVNLK